MNYKDFQIIQFILYIKGGFYENKTFTAAYRDDHKHNGAFCAGNDSGVDGRNIEISGGTVTATGGLGGAGIGGGYNGTGGSNITISGGTVTAEGGEYGSPYAPSVTTPSTTPPYTGRPSWVTTPAGTTTTTTSTTTTTTPADDDIDDDTDDENIGIEEDVEPEGDVETDEDTDTTQPAGDDYEDEDTDGEVDADVETPADDSSDGNPITGVAISFTGLAVSAMAVMLTRKRKNK